MKKSVVSVGIALSIGSIFAACGANNSSKAATQDTVAATHTPTPPAAPKHAPINKPLNDMARYIAGLAPLPGCTLDTSLLNSKEWKALAVKMDEAWSSAGAPKIGKMKPWVDQELGTLNAENLFYPFAGADAMNAVTLFPKVHNYYMVGLEPVGTPPDFKKIQKAKDIEHYFATVNQSLESILNFSFFRTISMAKDFHQSDVNGTMHVLLWFLERTGNSIVAIDAVGVNAKGELKKFTSFELAQKDSLKNKGAAITFLGPDSTEHTLTYFSINLSNDFFNNNIGFQNFIKAQHADVTYIKSASYLMHKVYFSGIRSFILANSRAILQDDSGIPWRLFSDSLHTVTLFGAYTGTIALFPTYVQPDLDKAYKTDPSKVRPLPFGIGYKYMLGESNLMLSVKK